MLYQRLDGLSGHLMDHLGVVHVRIPGKELTYLSDLDHLVAIGRLGCYVVKVVIQVGVL